MKYKNACKRVCSLISIVFFVMAAIAAVVKLIDPDMGLINILFLRIMDIPIQIPQLTPFVTNFISVIVFCFIAMIAAVVMGISGKHCGFPVVMGIFILISLLVMAFQDKLYTSSISEYISNAAYAATTSEYFEKIKNFLRLLLVTPTAILAIYMIVAPFIKIKGWIWPVVAAAVVLLLLVLSLVLCIPLDVVNEMSNLERVMIFRNSLIKFSLEELLHRNVLDWAAIKAILGTWLVLIFQYTGFLLYLPAALHRPKEPKNELIHQ